MDGDLISRVFGRGREKLLREYYDLLRDGGNAKTKREGRFIARALINDSSSFCRDEAVEVLGLVGNRTDLFALKKACSDPDSIVRMAAYSSLAKVGGKGQFGFLREAALVERDETARSFAYMGMFACDREQAVAWFKERWSLEKSEIAEEELVSCLAEAGVDGAVERLREMRDTTKIEWVHHSARMSLEKLGLD